MTLWEKIKTDLKKGADEGMVLLKEGAGKAKQKAEELTVEGKKRYAIFDLKRKVHAQLSELGGVMYELLKEGKEKAEDDRAMGIVEKVKGLEEKLAGLEKKVS
jgi:hypothetical protein